MVYGLCNLCRHQGNQENLALRGYCPLTGSIFAIFSTFEDFKMTDIFAAIDITTVAAAVIALGVGIIGITMAFKGIDLGKRAVRKV